MSEKIGLDHFEHGHKETVIHPDDVARHGDRALSLIGDERVTLTDEEVGSFLSTPLQDITNTASRTSV